MESRTSKGTTVKEDIWIKTTCEMCFCACAIRVHRVDGVVVKVEGEPDCPTTRGAICPRGASSIMHLYDPNRVNVPLKRTNPEKGIGVDPKWVEISWDEALDTITEKLKKIRADDPRKLINMATVQPDEYLRTLIAFGGAFGSPNYIGSGAGGHCANAAHSLGGMTHCGWTRMPDPDYIKYYLNFGCPSGYGMFYCINGMTQRMADAKLRGMKHVAIEPWMGMAGAKADEWIPIRPGTDAAMALAMVNLLLNEYRIYDAESLKKYTNGPYLVRPDGYYLRDKQTNKPLIWDPVDKKAKTYDDATMKDVAIEGEYTVNGVTARPAFSLIKEHVKKYTPELASAITTVPADTIRRLAREFGEAAQIGKTIVIDGKELPYRPVVVGYFRGAEAHRHATLTCVALELLQEIVGATNVPGGSLGLNSRCFGHPETGQPAYSPSEGPDGLVQVGLWLLPHKFWPMAEVQKPERTDMCELVPTGSLGFQYLWGMSEGEKYKIPYKPEFVFQMGGNHFMNTVNPKVMEKAFKDLFTVAFSLILDESTEFADIVLPDASFLERLDLKPDWESSNAPTGEWAWHIRQPVVEPMFQRRPAQEVLLELGERLGLLPGMYSIINHIDNLKEPYTLDPTQKYTWAEIVDRRFKGYFGPERGLDWFKKNGLIKWPKKVEEVYWRPFVKARVPIYFEVFKSVGEKIERIKKEYNIPGFDTADFQPISDWKPCASFNERRPEFDLYAVFYRVPFHTATNTYSNPWLDEISGMDPYVFNIALNPEVARKKGIKAGDWVEIESAGTGNKVEGRVVLTEAVHPEVVAYASGGGHWAKGMPIASQKGKGVALAWMIPLSWDYMDTLSMNCDLCVKVKVSKKG